MTDATPEVDPIEALGSNPSSEDVLKALGVNPEGEAPAGEPAAESDQAPEGGEQEQSGDEPDDSVAVLDGERPDWLLPKFKSVEDQAKAYVDAQKLLGKAKPVDKMGIPKPGEEGPEAEAEAEGAEAPRVLDTAYVQELGSEWYANDGKLTDETYDKLMKDHHADRALVDAMMSNQAAVARAENITLIQAAGVADEAEFGQVAQWASKNLPEAEQNAINEMLGDISPVKRGAAIQHLKTKFDAARGPSKPRLAGKQTGSPSLKPITTQAEVSAAMDDARYFAETPEGAAYRKQVNQRIELGQQMAS